MRRLAPWLLVLLLVAGIGVPRLAGGDDQGGGGTAAGVAGVVPVVRVVDGDTIVVRRNGAEERVRYIGIDTPESVKPNTPVQCYAKKASAENERLVAGRTVRLAGDAEARDRYGRTLAYVTRVDDGLFVNAELVRRGFATTLTIAPNVRFASRFAALARDARRTGRGLWGACSR
jgi:micrococcal nuclease